MDPCTVVNTLWEGLVGLGGGGEGGKGEGAVKAAEEKAKEGKHKVGACVDGWVCCGVIDQIDPTARE